LGGDGSGGSSFVATITVASLCSLVSTTQKEERKNNKKRGTNSNKEKNCSWGPSRNRKNKF
jgi:hypothetical protein